MGVDATCEKPLESLPTSGSWIMMHIKIHKIKRILYLSFLYVFYKSYHLLHLSKTYLIAFHRLV